MAETICGVVAGLFLFGMGLLTGYLWGKDVGSTQARDDFLTRLSEEYSKGWKAGRSNGIEHQKALIQEFLDDTDE